jgi:hypothetical protein
MSNRDLALEDSFLVGITTKQGLKLLPSTVTFDQMSEICDGDCQFGGIHVTKVDLGGNPKMMGAFFISCNFHISVFFRTFRKCTYRQCHLRIKM